MLLDIGIISREQEDNANHWNGESSIFVAIVDQVTFEGIHFHEQIIKGSIRILGRVILHLDDYEAEFSDIEVSSAVQVRLIVLSKRFQSSPIVRVSRLSPCEPE